MNIFDIIGPVMVGPSSSHTAGAVKIGYTARKLMREEIIDANILLHGSFLATGKGHGTDKALVAGLLGMRPDNEQIPESLKIADENGMAYSFAGVVIECDQELSADSVSWLRKLEGVVKVTYLSLEEEDGF